MRGLLLVHLTTLARPYLMARVNRNMPNAGLDAVEDIVTRMSTSIVDHEARDGVGYASAFYDKLQQRLTDRHRAWRIALQRYQPFEEEDETGEVIEPVDLTGVTPEDIVNARQLIDRLAENHRRALVLKLAGFKLTSPGGICETLGVSPKTAKDWIQKAEAQVRSELGVER